MSKIIGIIVLLFSTITSTCYDTNNTDDEMKETDREVTYLALGDSYTIGESVDLTMRWPVQLADRLREDSIYIADPDIIARTGWTTDELMNGIESVNPGNDYDLVSLLIGVNNQYQGRDIYNFRDELVELISIAITCANNEADNVIVLSIPDWGVMPFASGRDKDQIAEEIDAFNDVVKQECNYAGVEFFDITEISRRAAYDASLVASDGLHPSGKMYGLWVEKIYSHVYELLK
ncbi:MAG: SGNH/GDSL hydrolase family protein [Bacteroidales bacterium]|nr:SGNH/GDSL hydrolase family protein [Bacteroidales bacterium]